MKNIFLASLFLVALSSCEKVIDIDLNSSDPQYVVEGEITNEARPYQIKITKTVNFSESNNFPTVSGAVVTIADDAGNTETLTETKSGIYETKILRGVPTRTYTLTVKHNGKTLTSVTKMPALVPLLNINTIPDNFGGGGPGGGSEQTYSAVPLYNDPAGVKNFYRFIQVINSKLDSSFLVRNDNLYDGKQTVQPIFSRGTKILKGDTLNIAMQCIDNQVYDYFYSLNQSSGDGPGGGTTPSNPVNNIVGGLGYFSACSVSSKAIIVQ